MNQKINLTKEELNLFGILFQYVPEKVSAQFMKFLPHLLPYFRNLKTDFRHYRNILIVSLRKEEVELELFFDGDKIVFLVRDNEEPTEEDCKPFMIKGSFNDLDIQDSYKIQRLLSFIKEVE